MTLGESWPLAVSGVLAGGELRRSLVSPRLGQMQDCDGHGGWGNLWFKPETLSSNLMLLLQLTQ